MTDLEAASPIPPEPAPTSRRRGRHASRWAALGLSLVLVAFVALLATRDPAQSTVAPSPLEGKVAPTISQRDLDGTQVTLESFRGRWVVVNFFATWCVPCQREHPALKAFAEAHPDDAQVVAVLFDDDPERAKRFFEENGGDWPVLVDPSGKVSLAYGVRGPPESFLITPDGVVAVRLVGEVSAAGLEALVAKGNALRRGAP